MAILTVKLYEFDPLFVINTTISGTTTYTGPAEAAGSATITDNEAGIGGEYLEDTVDESATAVTTIAGVTDGPVNVYAEEAWTLVDQTTGKEFQLVTFRVESGANTGYYTLSEIPLVQGRVYETTAYDTNPDVSALEESFKYSDYAESDFIVEGTDLGDLIDSSYTGDPGNDVVDGGDMPSTDAPTPLDFNWSGYADEQDLRNLAAPQDTGGIEVQVSYSDVQTNEEFSAETSGGVNDGVYVGPGETFSPTSAGFLYATGSADDSIVTFDFAAATGSGFKDQVENVKFRISDIDGLNDGGTNFQDIVTVRAFDAFGNEVDVNITGGSNHTVVNNTITASLVNYAPTNAEASALIEIAGPVSQIVVTYDNGGSTAQAVYFSDVQFEAVPVDTDNDSIVAGLGNDTVFAGEGEDTISGGEGDDILYGDAGADVVSGDVGNDTIYAGDGDTVSGGDGDDTFLIDASQLNSGTINIIGGENDEGSGDVLDFSGQLLVGSVNYSDTEGKSGTAELTDGTIVNFAEIESIICFASGTQIETPFGPRPVEDLRVGDLVLTRDQGPQPLCWVGSRTVKGAGRFAPVEFDAGSIGNTQMLRLSPQHRMLINDYSAALHFGEDEVIVAADFLVNGQTIRRLEVASVTYHHLMFDQHQLVQASGCWSESFYPGSYGLSGLSHATRDVLFSRFPELRSNPNGYGQAVRTSVKRQQAKLLAA